VYLNKRTSRKEWVIVTMLFLFLIINFANKAVLGLASTHIMQDLHISAARFGQIGSLFFLLFSISAGLIGVLVNRFPTKWALTLMVLVWSLVQLPMFLVSGLPMLILNRVVLGAGEGPAFPVAIHAAYKWFPNDRRAFPTSVISAGGAVGIGFVAPIVTYIILRYSWRAAFGVLGVAGLAWILVWLVVGREGPLAEPATQDAGPQAGRVPYARLLSCRTVVGSIVMGFSAYWLLALAVVWLPNYLNKGVGYSPTAVGWIVSAPTMLQILVVPALCILSERLQRRGVSSRVSRGLIGGACVMLAGMLTFALPLARGGVLPILFTAVAFGIGPAIFSLGPVMVAEVTPASQRGAVLGFNTAVSTLAGILAPSVMGFIVDLGADPAEGFRMAFMFTGALVVGGSIVGLLLVDPEADIRRFRRLAGGSGDPGLRLGAGDRLPAGQCGAGHPHD
jgi:MFS family permease